MILKRIFFESWNCAFLNTEQSFNFSSFLAENPPDSQAQEAPEGENDGELGWAVDTAAGGEAGPLGMGSRSNGMTYGIMDSYFGSPLSQKASRMRLHNMINMIMNIIYIVDIWW